MRYSKEETIERIARWKAQGGKAGRVATMARELDISAPTVRKYLKDLPQENQGMNIDLTIGEKAVVARWLYMSRALVLDFDNLKEEDIPIIDGALEAFNDFQEKAKDINSKEHWLDTWKHGTIWDADYFLRWGVEPRTADKYLRLICIDEENGRLSCDFLRMLHIDVGARATVDSLMVPKGFSMWLGRPEDMNDFEREPKLTIWTPHYGENKKICIQPTVKECLEYYKDKKIPARGLEWQKQYFLRLQIREEEENERFWPED
jgi:hypothetical protein